MNLTGLNVQPFTIQTKVIDSKSETMKEEDNIPSNIVKSGVKESLITANALDVMSSNNKAGLYVAELAPEVVKIEGPDGTPNIMYAWFHNRNGKNVDDLLDYVYLLQTKHGVTFQKDDIVQQADGIWICDGNGKWHKQ